MISRLVHLYQGNFPQHSTTNFGIIPHGMLAEHLGQIAEVLAIDLAIQRAKTRNMGVLCVHCK